MYCKIEKNIVKWLSPEATYELKMAVANKINSETRERVLKNPNSEIDYGYSIPGLSPSKQLCLESVRELHELVGKRPKVADLGAGFGSMTWMLLAAGADVDAFEIQVPTAKELQKRLKKMDDMFWQGEKLDDILKVYSEDSLSALKNDKFEQRYDVIWTSHMLHFLTPDQMKEIVNIFNRILKPDGMIFIEVNCVETFQPLDPYKLIKNAVENGKKLNYESPGFLCVNAANLINQSLDQPVESNMVVSVLDQNQMREKNIPIRCSAYGENYLGHDNTHKNEYYLNKRKQLGYNFYSIDRFHNVANLIDDEIAQHTFGSKGFNTSCYYYGTDGKTFYSKTTINDKDSYGLSIFLKKSSELKLEDEKISLKVVKNYSIFKPSIHHYLCDEAKHFCGKEKHYEVFLKAIESKDYALALRKVSAVGSLPLVRLLLKFRTSLGFDVNQPSQSNGWTAMDWIKNIKDKESSDKQEIIGLLERHGALSKDDLSKSKMDKNI